MPEGIDLEQKRREEARWRMMRVIDAGRPIAVSEQIIWRVLADIKLSPSLITVRRELAYLSDIELRDIGYPDRVEAEKAKPFWRA